jgi:hypothetical protein
MKSQKCHNSLFWKKRQHIKKLPFLIKISDKFIHITHDKHIKEHKKGNQARRAMDLTDNNVANGSN